MEGVDVRVPLLDVTRIPHALQAELEARAVAVLRSGEYILGPEVTAFERACAATLEVPHAIGVSNGSDALLMLLMALGIGPGDEVIVPSYTFFATAGAVARLGATPVFVDSQPETLNLDPACVAEAITNRTRAIIPVHLFGLPADLGALRRVAGELPLLEDAAQAFLARYEGRPVGGIGLAGAFSFFPSKNLGGYGDGGLLTTHDHGLAERLRVLRAHGSQPKYHHAVVGGNFRLDALQAALLSVKLPHVSSEIAGRRANAALYVSLLADDPRLQLPPATPEHTFNQFVVRFADRATRDHVQRALSNAQVGTAVYYPVPLHQQECFATAGEAARCPVAEHAAETSLALPVFAALRPEELDYVVTSLRNAL
ncbi:MAG: DegT/DnrJ/EryC1/StrS family aminotransferase [Sandaracinaceae bacterium]|nr:DegT/DnrJ/EryC1/StrS family aminotransferase [Myxococcales bacterium]MCB9659022.1 DegT/DnrJ/EryC1/StrS family aminotransferase [Sandaracinaceae bacterium]